MEELARTKTTQPAQSREKGQRSLDLPEYITRILPIWRNPEWLLGNTWRAVVRQQPVAMICRETLIENITSLDWKIESRDSNKRDEYKSEIDYYSSFLENSGDMDWTQLLEWTVQDYLDLGFGGAVELGRENDAPEGKVRWIKPIDGATLFPTLNSKWPIGQYIRENPGNYVYFPYYAINRLYMSPRTEIKREGWGMAPPEKIYLALELLNRGDVYYANLLLDTPPAGILDLLDMEKSSADKWLESWKNLLGGTDPFKIPVLYEHEKAAQFVSFTKSPTEVMFDKATLKYTAIVTAGYGMSIGDIGLPTLGSGGETLAGSIRQERRTRRTGFGILKKKIKFFIDRMLPKHLEFKWIDMDDEMQVAVGRARLATATAMELLVGNGILLPDEARQQLISDGLLTISIPESIEGGDKVGGINNDPNRQVGSLGNPVPPSQGGHGEVKASYVMDDAFSLDAKKLFGLSDATLRRAIRASAFAFHEVRSLYRDLADNGYVDFWNQIYDTYLYTGEYPDGREVPESMGKTVEYSMSSLSNIVPIRFDWSVETEKYLSRLFSEIYRKKLYQKSLLDYETGKSDVEPDIDSDSLLLDKTKVVRGFDENINKLLSLYKGMGIELLYKSILSGIRKYLTRPDVAIKLADDLDIETFIGDNILEAVKEEISKSFTLFVEDFGDKFVEESIKYLEEV